MDTFSSIYIRITTSTDLGTEGIIGQRKDGAENFWASGPPPAGCTPRKWGMKLSNLQNLEIEGG